MRFVSVLFLLLCACLCAKPVFAQGNHRAYLQELERRTTYGHCETEAAIQIARERHKAGINTIQDIQSVFQDSVISPSGRFKVYFDTSGPNAATLEYVKYVAAVADTAYMLEVDTLGYPKPPYSGADSTWHIDLEALGGGKYGFTTQLDNSGTNSSPDGLPLSPAFITMDHAFSDSLYVTHGFDAARVTVFHEFHHVIQFGDFGIGQLLNDVNFREMTSVWMEIRSSPWIKDYEQYVPTYIDNLDQQFDLMIGSGYPQCVWWQFLSYVYGDDIVKKTWTWYSNVQADFLLAFDSTLHSEGSSFCSEYMRFGAGLLTQKQHWHDSREFPIDASLFDQMRLVTFSPSDTITEKVNPASLAMFECQAGQSLAFLVLSRTSDRSEAPTVKVSFGPSAFSWSSEFQDTYCDTTSALPNPTIFPQPFISDGSELLHVLASDKPYPPISVALNIYSINNTLIRHIDTAPTEIGGNWYISWDGADDASHIAPSGVYYYSMMTDGVQRTGKFVVVRK